jgi:hypothetical protein
MYQAGKPGEKDHWKLRSDSESCLMSARVEASVLPCVWVVVLNYKGAQITLNCVDSVLKVVGTPGIQHLANQTAKRFRPLPTFYKNKRCGFFSRSLTRIWWAAIAWCWS